MKIEIMKAGITFKSVRCEENVCPLTKIRRRKPGLNRNGLRVKEQRGYKCSGGVERKSKSSSLRPYQRVKYVGCEAKLNINE